MLTDKDLLLKTKNILKPIGSIRILDNHEDLILKGDYSASDHKLTVVSKNKITVIDLDKIVPNTMVKSTEISKILHDGEQDNLGEKIYFEDHNRDIQFVFSSVDKNFLGKTTLFYKINKDAWKPFKEPRTLKFSHIDQGKYSLQIKSVNEDGYEKMMPHEIEFTVLGPIYIRWWFNSVLNKKIRRN